MKIKLGEDLLIDSESRQVYKGTESLNLPDLSFRLLMALVECAPETVSKDALIEKVWRGRVVSEETLKQRISRLRTLLQDDPNAPQFIASIRGEGYRLVATTQEITEREQHNKTSVTQLLRTRSIWLALVVALFTAGAVMLSNQESTKPASQTITAQDHINTAILYYRRYLAKDNLIAQQFFNKALLLEPNNIDAHAGLANAYSQSYLQFGGDYSQSQLAAEHAKTATEINADNAGAFKALGLAYLAQGKYYLALEANQQASVIDPAWAAPINNSAELQSELGNQIAAFQLIQQAIALDVKDPIPYAQLGVIYQSLSLNEQAQEAYQYCLSLKPDYLFAQQHLVKFWMSVNNYSSAQSMLDTIFSNYPDNKDALYLQGLLYLIQNQSEQAKQAFTASTNDHVLGIKILANLRLAILIKDDTQIIKISNAIQDRIEQGDLRSGLYYGQALIATYNKNYQKALIALQTAVISGFSQLWLIKQDPQLQALLAQDKAKNIGLIETINKAEQKQASMATQVQNLMHLDQADK